jgi:hypothetical protein
MLEEFQLADSTDITTERVHHIKMPWQIDPHIDGGIFPEPHSPNSRPWTQEETEYLAVNFPATKDRLLAEHLGRTIKSVRMKAEYLGLRKLTGKCYYCRKPMPDDGCCEQCKAKNKENIAWMRERDERIARNVKQQMQQEADYSAL